MDTKTINLILPDEHHPGHVDWVIQNIDSILDRSNIEDYGAALLGDDFNSLLSKMLHSVAPHWRKRGVTVQQKHCNWDLYNFFDCASCPNLKQLWAINGVPIVFEDDVQPDLPLTMWEREVSRWMCIAMEEIKGSCIPVQLD